MLNDGPSEAALEAARAAKYAHTTSTGRGLGLLSDILRAAHDPKLGLDRSICLRAVVEALQKAADEHRANTGEKFGVVPDAPGVVKRAFCSVVSETPPSHKPLMLVGEPHFKECGICAAMVAHPNHDGGEAVRKHMAWHEAL
jgi:hypothetical protein